MELTCECNTILLINGLGPDTQPNLIPAEITFENESKRNTLPSISIEKKLGIL